MTKLLNSTLEPTTQNRPKFANKKKKQQDKTAKWVPRYPLQARATSSRHVSGRQDANGRLSRWFPPLLVLSIHLFPAEKIIKILIRKIKPRSGRERRSVAEMPLPAFLAAAARLAVLVAAAVTAANAASFARYRRRHLRRIPNPIDESADPVADFRALPSASAEETAGPAPLSPSLSISSVYLFLNYLGI